MFSALRKLFCFNKEPRTPLGFCDGPRGERQKFFWCGCAREDRYCQPYDPENPFHEAICKGKVKKVLNLLSKNFFHVNDKDTRKRTALHFACFYGHLHLVHFMLFNDCEINALDKNKCTPLMKAVQSRETEIVAVLLGQGADPNIKDINGESAIHQAVYVDSVEIVRNLHEFGGDIEYKTKDGFTPLLLALRERKLLIAEYLIRHGANIHERDDYERTTLMYAVKWDSEDLVDLLLKKGVDHSSRDAFRWSAMMYAMVGKRQVKGAIVNHQNSLLSIKQRTFPGHHTEDTSSSGQSFISESPISVGMENKSKCETQQDIPENTMENGTDDLPTVSTEHENIEAQEEELELETIQDLNLENEDASARNEGYQNLEYSRKAAHSSTIGNNTEEIEMNKLWAIKCPHPELREYNQPIQQPETEPRQIHADKDFSEELKEENPKSKPEGQNDKIEGNQDFNLEKPALPRA